MKVERVLSRGIENTAAQPWSPQLVEGSVIWKSVPAKIVDERDGRVTHEASAVEVPEHWSQTAINILSKNYIRKNGIPVEGEISVGFLTHVVPEPGVPGWLCRSEANPNAAIGAETSAKQVFRRLAGHWTYIGWKNNYFDTEEDAQAFYDEIYLCLAKQLAAPNSPQWFNTGLYWAYGIKGPNAGQWYYDEAAGAAMQIENSYERPQPHACFLTSIEDDLVNPGGIMDAVVREAQIFKYGSGSGMNVSKLRSKFEKLSGGGKASGVMSWLRILDSSAGAIQSGGTTRRAAKMVAINDDHPELPEFINWKVREESKAAAMYAGSHLIKLYHEGKLPVELHHLVPEAMRARLKNGFEPEIFGIGFEEEANRTIDGQNSNNSVRVTDAFLAAAQGEGMWSLTARTTGDTVRKVKANELLDSVCHAAWACADPGLLFDTTINAWNTCAADGRINTTNPCAEFHHLDGSACNLASLRLSGFILEDGNINIRLFEHVCWLWTMVLDISVTMAAFPAEEFAVGAYLYRTLGLGFADLGGMLMRLGIPYDSALGRTLAAALTALMNGVAYDCSAAMARELGAFPRWEDNREHFMRVMRNHARAVWQNAEVSEALGKAYEGLNVEPVPLDWDKLPNAFKDALSRRWSSVLGATSFRNAQATLIAPTGTISFVMDCDTTGVEPEFALVKWKNLAGGGTFKLVNPAVQQALSRLGYNEDEVLNMMRRIDETGTIEGAERLKPEHLAVFDCANPARSGGRYLSTESHLLMMAAVQPHLSGAISKTVSLPNHATVEDVKKTYLAAHQLMIKAVALYRDGCKLAQPLQTAAVTAEVLQMPVPAAVSTPTTELALPAATLARGERERAPARLRGVRQKARIGGQTVYWRIGEWQDGRPCEIFIDLANVGTTLDGFANSLAKMTSMALQYGAPAEKIVDTLFGIRFEPAGVVELHDEVAQASSIVDLIARDLGIHYLGRTEMGQKIQAQAVDDPTKIVALDKRAIAAVTEGKATGDTCYCGGLLVTTGYGGCKTCSDCGEKYGGCG